MFWKRKIKATYDENAHWQKIFGKPKKDTLNEHKRAVVRKSESIITKAYNVICDSIREERTGYWSQIKYYYLIQSLILGGFMMLYLRFINLPKENIPSAELWSLLLVVVLGIVYGLLVLFNYYNFSSAIAEYYSYLTLLEPYVFGRFSEQKYKHSSRLYYTWETFSVLLAVPLWIIVLLFIMKVDNLEKFAIIFIFVFEVVVGFLMFYAIPELIRCFAEKKNQASKDIT